MGEGSQLWMELEKVSPPAALAEGLCPAGSQAWATGRWSAGLGRVDPHREGGGGGFLRSFSSQLSLGFTGIPSLSVNLIFTVSPRSVSQGAKAQTRARDPMGAGNALQLWVQLCVLPGSPGWDTMAVLRSGSRRIRMDVYHDLSTEG